MSKTASLIIPAHNEAQFIGPCLRAVLASDPLPEGWGRELIVIANGCTDDTAERARAFCDLACSKGWVMTVIDTPTGGKLSALNLAEASATGDIYVYLDADVLLDAPLLAQLVAVLDTDSARYASGTPRVAQAHSWITRAYARIWQQLPFVQTGVPGFGLFALNRAGRAVWTAWPDIISDDTFARLSFAPAQRHKVTAGYSWPMVEGFENLVRVRRRQDAGVTEIHARFPQLSKNEDTQRPGLRAILMLAARNPVAFCVYVAVAVAVKTPLYRSHSRWARGR